MKRRFRRYAITTVIAAAPAAVLCAYVTNLLVPTEPLPKPVSLAYIPTAVIENTNDTLGIADSDIYGLSLPNGQLDTAEVDRHLQAMKDLGVDSVRVLIPWADIQPVPSGQFPTPEWEESMWTRSQYIIDKADELGLSVLGVLNTTPAWGDDPDKPGYGIYTPPDPDLYAAWAATVAERFEGKVSAYEIWNEPNYVEYWTAGPDPEHYTEILKAAYEAIKGVDNEALVVAGVVGTVQNSGVTMNPVDFIQRMYAADAEGFFDALSIHPYSNEISFSEGLDPDNQWQTPIEQLIAIRQLMLANDDEELKIWATEYGLSTTIKDEETQAAWVKDFLDTWDNYDFTGPAFLYTLRDRLNTTTEEGSMGIFEYDWSEKLVAKVIRCATKGIDCGPLEPEEPEEPEEPGPNPVGELAEAIQAIVQQLYTVVTQALAAVTEFANAIVNTIVEALNNLFSAVNPAPQIADVPAETRMAIAGSFTTAAAEVTGEETPADAAGAGEAPEATEPGAAEPTVSEPEATEPTVTEPEVTEPEVTETEVTEPEATEPTVTEPEVTEPEVTETEVTEPEVTETEEPTVVETEAPQEPGTEEPTVVEPDEPQAVEPDDTDASEEDTNGRSNSRGESDDSDDKGTAGDDDTTTSDSGTAGDNDSTSDGSAGDNSPGSGGTSGAAGGADSDGGSNGSDGSDGGGSDSSGGGSDNVSHVEPGQDEVIVAA